MKDYSSFVSRLNLLKDQDLLQIQLAECIYIPPLVHCALQSLPIDGSAATFFDRILKPLHFERWAIPYVEKTWAGDSPKYKPACSSVIDLPRHLLQRIPHLSPILVLADSALFFPPDQD